MKKEIRDVLFDVVTPLGFHVRVTRSYWQVIVSIKHPVMEGHEKDVRAALEHPEEIRRSKADATVYLFYKTQRKDRWVCAVSKKLNGEGFLITAYPTDSIKAGEKLWPK
ncbi:MAG: hypothetical protein COW13_01960 [Candidatus Omnitrophica bacterium CG12_big_fil_rev_8_21_14_0_65_50_5]|nr:MAG: hypothetical protein COW13_01960 [Candidatus Omnitrophica bacterium CG12_big_fil_rev_8_21_14_0_65_50_5]